MSPVFNHDFKHDEGCSSHIWLFQEHYDLVFGVAYYGEGGTNLHFIEITPR